ncbi:hypothetical protein [Metabacillus sp. FJAT-53654]|uniref:Uncharacterized protein n=1 Tax=Metabacillus rhizosphaerae TaxID=3117747 RepID=A0ABZ2MN47_9BACI
MKTKSRKSEYLIATSIIIMYSLLGHLFNIDILKVISIRKNEFSILGVVICIIKIILLPFLIRRLKKTK